MDIEALQKAAKEELQVISDVGEVVAESIVEWFSDKANKELIQRLRKAGVEIIYAKQKKSREGKLKDRTFVLTGSLSSLSRNEAKEKIRKLGGSVAETVSRKTSYVVMGDLPGSKKRQAEQLHVPILTEQEFLKMLS
mgnify:CR=1 FL=1